jgi:molecular chaperone DnaK
LVAQTIECVREALRHARLSPEDIDRVILAGGSTKNRAVYEAVRDCVKDPYKAERVDEAVSHGAAILGASLLNPGADPEAPKVTLDEITGHTLGIDVHMRELKRLVFVPIILQQSPLPAKSGYLGIATPGQKKVDISVFRGDDPDPDKNEKLGILHLPVTFGGSEGVQVAAIFELDESGLLNFTAMEFDPSADLTKLQYATDDEGILVDMSVMDTLSPSVYRKKTIQIGTK